MSEYERLTDKQDLYWAIKDITLPAEVGIFLTDAINRLAELEDKITGGNMIKLPCKVGDTIYCIKDKEIFDCKVSMVFQKADKTWHFRYSYRKYVTRSPWIENPKYEWMTYQNECTRDDFGREVFTDKAQAEARLKELKGEGV